MPAKHPFPTGFKQLADPRDDAFPLDVLLMAAPKTKPVSKAWKLGPNTNQGSESSCVGHACWNRLTSEPVPQSPPPRLTPSLIYTEAQKIDEWGGEDYEGTSVRAGLRVLKSMGLVKAFYWAQSVDQVVEYLLKMGPLVTGLRWTNSMMSPVNGIIRPKGGGGSGHATLFHSANWKDQMISGRNSWGKTWGRGGDFAISFQDVDLLLKEGGVAAACIES